MPNPGNIVQHKFKKGQTGNPGGRPKELPVLKEILAEALNDIVNGRTRAKRIITALIVKAEKGDVRAAEVLMDRAYGKAKQALEFEGVVPLGIIWNETKSYESQK